MARKIAIALACLCMVLISTCAAFADQEEFTVYIGGNKMTASEDGAVVSYYVNGAGGAPGTVSSTEPSGWNAKFWYDTSEKALMLEMKDLDLSGKGIYAEDHVTLVITGENKLSSLGLDQFSTAYKHGIYAEKGLVISDKSTGTLVIDVADAGKACYGIYSAEDIVINGGSLNVRAGKAKLDETKGIYSLKKLKINGGSVEAYGGTAVKDFSVGVGAYEGIDILGGKVTSVGGAGPYSVGLCCDKDLNIGGDAVVYAKSGEGNVRIYSYGTFVAGDLRIGDSAHFTSIAGTLNDESVTGKEKRCFGIYLGKTVEASDDLQYSGGSDVLWITGGTVIAKSMDDGGYRSHAVVFYDADKMGFSDAGQPNDKWYQWKISEDDAMTRSMDAAYPDAGKWESATGYFQVEPVVSGAGGVIDETPDTGDDGSGVIVVIMMIALTMMMGAVDVGRKGTNNTWPF